MYLLWPALTIAEAGLRVLDSTDSTLSSAVQGRGRRMGGGIPCSCSATTPAPVWAWGSSGGSTFTVQSAIWSLLLSYCHICHLCEGLRCKSASSSVHRGGGGGSSPGPVPHVTMWGTHCSYWHQAARMSIQGDNPPRGLGRQVTTNRGQLEILGGIWYPVKSDTKKKNIEARSNTWMSCYKQLSGDEILDT